MRFVSLFLRFATALENGYVPLTYSSTSIGCLDWDYLTFYNVISYFFRVYDPFDGTFSSLIYF